MKFTAYPAIDVLDGRVVRLRQGDYARESRYSDDPFAVAQAYAAAGARWLHLVDLDGARSGGYTLMPLLARLAGELGLQVQTGGGVRDPAAMAQVLHAGAARVIVGSVAVSSPEQVLEWLRTFGSEAVTVALDAREDPDGGWRLPLHGWTRGSDARLLDLLDRYADGGLRHLLCTDISRDGMLSGPNLALYRTLVARAPSVALQASGGIRDVADVAGARDAGCAGVVLGKALLKGHLQVREALAC